MNRGFFSTAFLLLTAILPANAQQVSVGQLVAGGDTGQSGNVTLIDIVHPATADGALTTATVRTQLATGATCPATFKVRFYRSTFTGDSSTLSMIAERGPFSIDAATKTVTLTPAVDVRKNDMMGVFQQGSGCGLSYAYGGAEDVGVLVVGDYRGGPISDVYPARRVRPSFRASSDPMVLVGLIPAVGVLPGSLGSQFRTSFQITNPDNDTSQSLKVVFHPRGSASTSDPSVSFVLGPHETNSSDLLQQMGVSGLGTLDVYSKSWAPVMAVRVFNDQGTSGTNGFSQPLIAPGNTLHSGESAQIVFPNDLTKLRMNIGVRTFDQSVELRCFTLDAGGTVRGFFSRNYGPNFFEQANLQAFDSSASSNGSFDCGVLGGDLIIYTSTTDNVTNDSAITIVPRR